LSLLHGVEAVCFSDTVLPVLEMVLRKDDLALLKQAEQGKKVRLTIARTNRKPVHFVFQGRREQKATAKKSSETQLVGFSVNKWFCNTR